MMVVCACASVWVVDASVYRPLASANTAYAKVIIETQEYTFETTRTPLAPSGTSTHNSRVRSRTSCSTAITCKQRFYPPNLGSSSEPESAGQVSGILTFTLVLYSIIN